jgi:hypothetical protein
MFSVDRAMEHVKHIASEPHPVGSKAHGVALTYLIEQLRALPLEVDVQSATFRGLQITNVLARPQNPAGSNIVLLVAHYDSVASGPGAGDDGAGAATLLEAARLFSAHSPGKNEVAYLFTDAEENGLEGAMSFIRDNSNFVKRVRVMLNFEARGNRGPVTMFETGPRNLELIRLLRKCPYPVATSFAQDIYRRMPNDTDLTRFLKAGVTGYNFSVIMGIEAYHRPADNWQNLDPRSLAHYGSYAISLGRILAEADLDKLASTQDGIFFPLLGRILVVYPDSWAMPLAIGTTCLFGVLAILGLVRRRLKILRVLIGLVVVVVLPAIPFFIFRFGMRGFTALVKDRLDGSSGFLTGYPCAGVITFTALGLTLVCVLAMKAWLSRRFGAAEMTAGALIVWLILAVLTASAVRGFSYMLVWPALFGVVAFGVVLQGKNSKPVTGYAAMVLSLAPACLLFAPAMLLAYHALTIGLLPLLAVLTCLVGFLIHVPSKVQNSSPMPSPH